MNQIIVASIFGLLSFNTFGASEVIKTCQAELKSLETAEVVSFLNIKILKRGNSYIAKVSESNEGRTQENEHKAEISENSVRAGLTGDLDDVDNLNTSEKLITHALSLSEIDPDKRIFDSGIDLKAVRSAKVYSFGDEGDIGMTSIVEAKDEKGKVLGSFLGGFVVTPCK